ncbi:MAG: rubrerythrin family protein [Crenarchaeota archaeon]|jgi:rubrerythrin|nr:rubrerythrin family protein [Thermoproteota archaeon]
MSQKVLNKSPDNLKKAFSEDSQRNRRYAFYAKKAEEEGYKQVAKMFRAFAESENVHASNHFKRFSGIKSTSENIEGSLEDENLAAQTTFLKYLQEANQEGEESAAWSFEKAGKVEQVHSNLLTKAKESVSSKKDLPQVEYYVCNVCGNTVENSAPEICPICGAPRTAFFKVP